MRKAIRLMRLMTGWAIAVSLVVSNSSGMVLCFGHDGHVAVEPVHEDHCEHPLEEDGHAHETIAHTVASQDACNEDACFDVSLDLDKVLQARKELKHNLFPNLTASSHFAASSAAGFMPDRNGQRSPFNGTWHSLSQCLLVQRTIVLQL